MSDRTKYTIALICTLLMSVVFSISVAVFKSTNKSIDRSVKLASDQLENTRKKYYELDNKIRKEKGKMVLPRIWLFKEKTYKNC